MPKNLLVYLSMLGRVPKGMRFPKPGRKINLYNEFFSL